MTEEGGSTERDMMNLDTPNFLEQFGLKLALLIDNGLQSRFDSIQTCNKIRSIHVGFNCKRKKWGKKCLEIIE